MINRRNIRIKVMQCIYAADREAYPTDKVAEKSLANSIDGAFHAFLYALQFMARVARHANHEALKRKQKHLPSEEDKNFNTDIAENPIIADIGAHDDFGIALKQFKLDKIDNDDPVMWSFKKLYSLEAYKEYVLFDKSYPEPHKDILKTLVTEVMFNSEEDEDYFLQHISEEFSNWYDDEHLVYTRMINFIEKFQPTSSLNDVIKHGAAEEENEFAIKLFRAVRANDDELKELIEPKLQNWDIDRIASLDMILMKMALCELLYFDEIPVKVSINEYIDISKMYSTPKSKDFINGVLDKLMKTLSDEGRIAKSGRGLLN